MTELSLNIGTTHALVATICLPAAGAGPSRSGVLLFNAGVVHRIGPHRINVRLARRLAVAGIPSIRFDLSGQGDSDRAPGADAFDVQAVRDLRSAADELAAAAGCEEFGIFGFCSGGYHGFAAAKADTRVKALCIYDAFQFSTTRARWNIFVARVRTLGPWRAVSGWLRRQLRQLPAKLRRAPAAEAGFAAQSIGRDAFAREIARLLDRGTSVHFIYSIGFETYNYARQFDDTFCNTPIAGRATCDYCDGLNHTATLASGQTELMHKVIAWATRMQSGVSA